jgi:hypothetical protein
MVETVLKVQWEVRGVVLAIVAEMARMGVGT